jgi:hypothetical protein
MNRSSIGGKTQSRGGPVQSEVPEAQKATRTAAVVPASPSTAATNPPHTARWSSIELGPDLPMAVFTSTERWNPERIGAVAIYCSDGRWGESFDEFCQKHLQIPRYDRLALAGGPACFVPGDEKAEPLGKAVLEQLAFLVKVHELKRIILITHYGCAAYAERLQQKPDDCLPVQMEDLHTVAEKLRRRFDGVKVDAYLAMRRGSAVSFHAHHC